MDDREIVKLFWARSPQAVDALDEAYGPDLRRLAQRCGSLRAYPYRR